ncbi:MAG TPA: hypothetical protein VI316_07195 [Candidatus Dormibacteraeota bacterium]
MLKRLMQGPTDPPPAPVLQSADAGLAGILEEAGVALARLLAERHDGLAAHLYWPTIPLERLTGSTAVTLVADETVLREALRRVRAIRRAILADAEDRARDHAPLAWIA